jgi:cobalt-zinc-cadmium efflux system outer membrane protein
MPKTGPPFRSFPIPAILRISGIAGYCIFVLVAAGCIRYHAKPISLSRSLADFEARSMTAPELKNFLLDKLKIEKWPPEAWDLQALTRVAFFYHPDLDSARAQWAVAKAGRITAGESPNPTLNVIAGYNSTTPVSVVSPWIPEAALEIPVETAGKRGYRVAHARHLAEAARLGVISACWSVRSRLRRTLMELFAAQETEALLRSQLGIQSDVLRILEVQLSAGEASAYDVTQARIALENSRLAAFSAAEQRVRARVQLAAALGVPVRALDGVAISFAALRMIPADVPADEARRKALLNRSDILGALCEYAASQSALQLEIAKQYPDIILGPDFQLDQTDNKWALGLSLLLPLINRNRGPIAEAEARRAESAARFLSLQAKVIGDIEMAVASCRTASDRARTADEMLADLGKKEAVAKERFRLGEISRLELLGVQAELAANAMARLDAIVKAQQSLGDLEDELQIPLDPEEWSLRSPERSAKRE